MVTEHEIGRHHLRDAGDCSRVLVRAGLDLRLSYLDRGLAICRPHRAGQRLAKRTAVLTAKDVDGRCGRRGRRRQQLVAEGCGDRRDDEEQTGDTDPANPNPTGRCLCSVAVGHAAIQGSAVLRARMWFSICRRYVPARSIGACGCWSSRTSPIWQKPSVMAYAWKRSPQTSQVTATPLWNCSASTPTTSPSSTETSPGPPVT